MRKFYFLILLLISSALAQACDSNLTFDTLKARKTKGIIVGCGENPFGWQPTSTERGQVNCWASKQDGDHSHTDYITLAESKDVKADITHDWTKPAPQYMWNQFPDMYLENLPPNVLDARQCILNAWNCLKPGGQLVFDHQICQVQGDKYAVVSPFSISVPDLRVTYEPLAKATHEIEVVKTLFYKMAGITKDTPMDQQGFIELLNTNPALAELNKRQFNLNQKLRDLIAAAQCEQQRRCLSLREPLNISVCDYVRSFGFSNVRIEVNRKTPNPYNQRMGSTLVFATKSSE